MSGDPDRARIVRWFERHDEISPQFGRPWRDVHFFWQWGITISDLVARMRELGFVLDHFRQFGVWSERHPNIQQNMPICSPASVDGSDVPSCRPRSALREPC
jgi:hypothetical protein